MRKISRTIRIAMIAMVLLSVGCATTDAMRRPSTPAEWRAEMQPPMSGEEHAAVSEGPDLAMVIALAAQRNPRAASMRERWLAMIQVEPQALTPPDPTVGGQWMINDPTVNVANVDWSVGPQIQLPWPQKLWAQGKVAATQADVAQLEYEAAVREVLIDAKNTYYELFYLDRAVTVVADVEAMLRNDALLAYAELNIGRTQLNEAFRAESQAAQLTYDRLLLQEQRAAEAERLRTVLNLPPNTPIGPVRSAPVYTVSNDVDALQQRAELYAEVLKIQGLETQRASYETFLARLSRIPDINVGATYSVVMEPERAPAPQAEGVPEQPVDPRRGKGPLMAMLNMNLPIFEWRNRAMIQEQKALEQAMRLDALAELNDVRAAVARAYFVVRLTERLVALYDETLLPQAQAVMDQAEILFRNDQASFANVIETTLAFQNFTLARLRAIADHGQAIGELERVLGTTAEPRVENSAAPAEDFDRLDSVPVDSSDAPTNTEAN